MIVQGYQLLYAYKLASKKFGQDKIAYLQCFYGGAYENL